MRLDFLHNYPINKHANMILLQNSYPNTNIFLSKKNAKMDLVDFLGIESLQSLSFDFWSLRGFLSFFEKKIAYGIGNHQQIFLAAQSLCGQKITLNKTTGKINWESLDNCVKKGCKVFIIPSINQDIFSTNDYRSVFVFLQERLEDFILIVDISLEVSLNQILIENHEKIIFLLNGEQIGLNRGSGLLLSSKTWQYPFILEQVGIYEAFLFALKTRITIQEWSRELLLKFCQDEIGNLVESFIPLEFCAPNTLALRFSKIKARMLLQDLFIKGVYGVNGQECLFGLFRPSFVLQEMGYLQEESRELLSISCASLTDLKSVAKALCKSYLQIQELKII